MANSLKILLAVVIVGGVVFLYFVLMILSDIKVEIQGMRADIREMKSRDRSGDI